ncbi:radical SAM/SPASM domain-containing protein [Candidatus Nitrospira bockiana]
MFKNLMLGKLPHYTRKARHAHQLLRHSTPRRMLNLLQAEWALRRGKTTLTSQPYIYIIDPCNACNLRCPLCPTGAQTLGRPTKMMNLACFQSIIDQVKDYAIEVILHNWGESFLHPRIFDMIRLAADANIGTTVSSHFNNITDELIEGMIDSGLEHLTVSLDGATQAVYEQYRVRGNLNNALEGLERLQRRKRERKSATPIVEWQFIVMKHNEHEIPKAEALAKHLGIERFRLLSVGLPFNHLDDVQLAERWMSDNPSYRAYAPELMRTRGYLYDESCFYLYRAMTINPDGGVAPCCAIDHQKWDFGSVQSQTIAEIWNNSKYVSARSLFSDRPIEAAEKTVCDACPLYKQRKHRERELVIHG